MGLISSIPYERFRHKLPQYFTKGKKLMGANFRLDVIRCLLDNKAEPHLFFNKKTSRWVVFVIDNNDEIRSMKGEKLILSGRTSTEALRKMIRKLEGDWTNA